MQRERPTNRSARGWEKILATAREGFEAHLSALTSVEQVLQFGDRCLKDPDLKEPFRHFTIEDSHAAAVPWAVQVSSLHPEQECERSLTAASAFASAPDSAVFEQVSSPVVACLDLDPEPNRDVFSEPLRPTTGEIDLLSDCEKDGTTTSGRSSGR